MPAGDAMRTGIWRTSRPSSATPPSCDPPPVRTIPAGSMPWPDSRISVAQSSNVSRIRASMIWHISSRLTSGRPPRRASTTLISLVRRRPAGRGAVVDLEFLGDLEARLEPIATSFVTLLPPTGRTLRVERRAVGEQGHVDRAGADVGDRHAELLLGLRRGRPRPTRASSATSSSILTPPAMTHLVRFWTAVAEAVTMWVSTSSRIALISSGSLTPSWPSTMKSRGRTWSTSRFDGIWTARATSVARSMSSRVTSRPWPLTATAPREFWLSTCWPPTADEGAVDLPARTAAPPARRRLAIDWTVCSMLTTTPFFSPVVGTVPLPMIVSPPSRPTSPMSAVTFSCRRRSRPGPLLVPQSRHPSITGSGAG